MKNVFRKTIPVLMIMVLLLIVGCAAREQSTAPAPYPEAVPPGGMNDVSGKGEARFGGESDDYSGIDRKIVRSGGITLEVGDIVDAMGDVARLAEEMGGYVVSSNKYGDRDGRISGRVAIRIPAIKFDVVFDRLRQLAIDAPYERTESRDVTEEYTDLEARLHNLEATETQYLTLLEKAKTVEDILKVQRELSNVRGEIEQLKGRIQYLERTSDMSFIEVNLEEEKFLTSTAWSAWSTLLSAVSGLITFAKVLANIMIWVAIFCPIWIPILILVLRRWRKKKERLQA